MQNRHARRLLCLLAALALLLCGCRTQTAPGEESSAPESSDQTGQQQEPPAPARRLQLTSGGRAAYRILVPQDCTDELREAAEDLRHTLVDVTGVSFYLSADSSGSGEVLDGAGELVVGSCLRTEAQELLGELRFRDWAVCATEANILVSGHEDTTLLRAVRYLISALEQDGVTMENGDAYLEWTDYRYTSSTYRLEGLSLGGTALSEYRIVYAPDAFSDAPRQLALQVQQAIGRESGYVLPVLSDETPAGTYEILVGSTNRQSGSAELLHYRVAPAGSRLVFSAGGYYSMENAIEAFDSWLRKSADGVLDGIALEGGEELTVPEKDGDYRFASYNVLVEYDGWGSGGNIPSDVQLRKEQVSAILLGYLPDVAVLCEVFDVWSASLPPMLADVYDWVEQDLTADVCNRTPIIYRRDRLRLLDSGFRYIEQTVSTVNHRVVTWALFENRESGEQFLVFGTHLDSQSESERLLEAQKIAEFTEQMRQQYDVPAVLMGDLNSTVTGSAYLELDQNTDFDSACAPGSYPGVDHILCTPEADVTGVGTDDSMASQTASDHRMVYADLSWSRT